MARGLMPALHFLRLFQRVAPTPAYLIASVNLFAPRCVCVGMMPNLLMEAPARRTGRQAHSITHRASAASVFSQSARRHGMCLAPLPKEQSGKLLSSRIFWEWLAAFGKLLDNSFKLAIT